MAVFQCNICGKESEASFLELARESNLCTHCGSTTRFRSIIHILSESIFGSSIVADKMPVRKDLCGIGLSDWEVYAEILNQKFSYQNTYLHKDPELDITCPRDEIKGTYDFIIATDVFEHVPPPVSKAFEGAFSLLKPGGIFIFSVPYSFENETKEHFPELWDYSLEEYEGEWVLINRKKNGERELFSRLVFHGGEGKTLEMRLFSQKGLNSEFIAAGFDAPKIHSDSRAEYGILWNHEWSLPMSVRRP